MFLYLVRHGEAKKETEDPLQGLSEKGMQDIKTVAAYAAKLNMSVSRIFHSGKKRALQTAEVFAYYLKPEKGVSATDGLSPLDDPEIWFQRISQMNEDIMLVGHLPYLGKLSALILCSDKRRSIVNFKAGSIGCLRNFEDSTWSLEWMMSPEVIK